MGMRYWNDQRIAGRSLFAGGMSGDDWDNVALIIIDAASEAEARARVAGDPAVTPRGFRQVRPFDTQWVSAKYGEGGGEAKHEP